MRCNCPEENSTLDLYYSNFFMRMIVTQTLRSNNSVIETNRKMMPVWIHVNSFKMDIGIGQFNDLYIGWQPFCNKMLSLPKNAKEPLLYHDY